MSSYEKEIKFYWLQLKEDFFQDESIRWLEEQKPNGRDYAYFYLKLCLLSLKGNGVLIRKVGNMLIPYDNKKLSELTNIDFDTVVIAMNLLQKIGLIQILETGEIFLSQLENLIGSKSVGALKKQQQRLKQKNNEKLIEKNNQMTISGQNSGQVSSRNKNIDNNIYINNKYIYGELKNILLKKEEYEKLKIKFPSDYEKRINNLSTYIASKGKKYKSHYATILNWASKEEKNKNTERRIF